MMLVYLLMLLLCTPGMPTLHYSIAEEEDDTTAATQAYGTGKDDDDTPDIPCVRDAPTLQYNTTTEDEDDTTAVTQAYGVDSGDETTDIAVEQDAPTLQFNISENEDDTTAETQAYGLDKEDNQMPDVDKPSTSTSGQLSLPANQDRAAVMANAKVGLRAAGTRKQRSQQIKPQEKDDLTMETEVCGPEEGSETVRQLS